MEREWPAEEKTRSSRFGDSKAQREPSRLSSEQASQTKTHVQHSNFHLSVCARSICRAGLKVQSEKSATVYGLSQRNSAIASAKCS